MTAELTTTHTHIMRAGLLAEEARAWWRHRRLSGQPDPIRSAFTEYWFGVRSEARVRLLVGALQRRFDRFPAALEVLHQWTDTTPEERALICHWHVQLTDPLYRLFTGELLPGLQARGEIRQSRVVDWLETEHPGRWGMSTRLRFSSALLSCAYHAGILGTAKDPRPITAPRLSDRALGYILHLLRETGYSGSTLENPYLTSLGLEGDMLESRLRRLDGVTFRRMGHLFELDWRHDSLQQWAEGAQWAEGTQWAKEMR